MHLVGRELEADPADDVVLGVLACSLKDLEHREQERRTVGGHTLVERALNVLRRELGARIGAVPRVVVEVLVVPVEDPPGFLRGAGRAVPAAEIEHPESAGSAHRVEIHLRVLEELRRAVAVAVLDERVVATDDHRCDVAGEARCADPGGRVRRDVGAGHAEHAAEDSGLGLLCPDGDGVVGVEGGRNPDVPVRHVPAVPARVVESHRLGG